VDPKSTPRIKGLVVVGLSPYKVRTSLSLGLFKAFSPTREDISALFLKMLSGEGETRLEAQAYIHDYEETAVAFGHEPEEFTRDFESFMNIIREKIPPWIGFSEIKTVWLRTDTDILIFY